MTVSCTEAVAEYYRESCRIKQIRGFSLGRNTRNTPLCLLIQASRIEIQSDF